jgi:tritrans,polycis-undecaprenyl-diphosphate synthase [geranylgeranyl-diphosphate specific]
MHVGIIMDGNRRYAEKMGIHPRYRGHLEGKSTLEKLISEWVNNMKEPKYLTLYSFSLYNLKNRGVIEKKLLFSLLKEGFKELVAMPDIRKNKVRINVIGNMSECPKGLKSVFSEAMEATKNYKGKVLSFAVCYDGQDEILNAVKKIISNNVKRIDKNTFEKYMFSYGLPPLDLVIRTGGEKRLSGFMLWGSSYAELIFRDVLWPEYTPAMFRKDILEFHNRERRFGK